MNNYKVIKSDKIFEGKVFDVKLDIIRYDSSGNEGRRETAVHPGGAVVVAVTEQNKIIMVKQFRYPHQEWVMELPAGKLDEGEDPQLCATRELTEETGYTANKIEKLGKIYTTPGFCNEILHIYSAEELTAGNHNREEGEEGMEVYEFTLDEINEKIRNGEIVDAKTISGIYMYTNKK